MFDALYVGAAGMRGEQQQIDSIAHNLANLNTIGFRRGVTTFSEVSAALATTAANSLLGDSAEMFRGAGVSTALTLSSRPGELRQTGESLDLAIDGLGFIEVIRSDGTPAYSRAGRLRVNDNGELATADGSPLAAGIQIPSDAHQILVREDGRVLTTNDHGEFVELGQIELVTFPNATALRPAGANLYVADANAGRPESALPGEAGMGQLRQGFVESSNVQMADELVTMMLAQRAFELNSRVVQAADQLMSITNSLYR
ncbi:MAG TPA: flagellar hook-basal body complex protein [Steroidobacter sp.]|nr:flagellar hook-basal body complex protein [Steroidobacter sp.]